MKLDNIKNHRVNIIFIFIPFMYYNKMFNRIVFNLIYYTYVDKNSNYTKFYMSVQTYNGHSIQSRFKKFSC